MRARLPGPLGEHVPSASDEAAFARKSVSTFRLRVPAPGGAPAETVIGAVRRYRIQPGDTLLEVARWFDVGYNEIVDANPGVDAWLPPVGTDVVVPIEWVLPCCRYEGIVVNIPELRLYYFRRAPGDPRTMLVTTYPVGLGRDDRRTPRGTFKVRAKQLNPTWYLPESIRREHIEERGDARHAIPGGAPDNPLGRYRLQLTRRLYGIHGTDNPWGIGMQGTHGCIRLYPEDIARLFPLVEIGAPVEFTYQPVKVGLRGGAVWVEVQRDIYGYARSLPAAARAAVLRQKVADRVDPRLLDTALAHPAGVPFRISRDGRHAS
jgi:L,D-transpeptidase ErfK/SrfK